MFKYKVEKLPKKTHEIIVDIPWTDIKSQYDKAFSSLQKELVLEGFRKGNVPKAIAEKNISKEIIFQRLINNYIPEIYEELVKKESLKPIVSPSIDLVKAKENEDWQIKIRLAEKPEIKTADYKKIFKEVKDKLKKTDIWVPGKDKREKTAKEVEENKSQALNEGLDRLLKESSIELSDLITDQELNRKLSRLVDDVQKIGMTMDSYLKSKKITQESLKESFRKEIEDTYKIEFILLEIADKENITVEKKDLDELFANIKDEKERKSAESNAYMYSSILRKQKTIAYLNDL